MSTCLSIESSMGSIQSHLVVGLRGILNVDKLYGYFKGNDYIFIHCLNKLFNYRFLFYILAVDLKIKNMTYVPHRLSKNRLYRKFIRTLGFIRVS